MLAVVLLVQGMFFADGGLSALGLNIVNLGFIGAIGGYAIYRLLLRMLPKNQGGVILSAGVAAGVAVPLAAIGFVIQYAIGGTTDVSVGAVFTAMLGAHLIIGIGEGFITAMVIGSVVRSRPDLVYGAPEYTGVRTEVLS